MKKRAFIALLLISIMAVACTGYEYKPIPFKAAEAYPNNVKVFGAVVAAKAWIDESEARSAFGFNIRGAGLTPVQVVVDNKGDQTLLIVPDQTLLMDEEGNLWNLLPAKVAYERIDKHVAPGRMGAQGGTQAMIGAAAGGILGAAVGIVSDGDIGEYAMKGAAAGAAVGAVGGGYKGLDDPRSKEMIADDLRTRNLKDKAMKPKAISHGFLFFPGEIKKAKVLRLKLQNATAGKVEILELPMEY